MLVTIHAALYWVCFYFHLPHIKYSCPIPYLHTQYGTNKGEIYSLYSLSFDLTLKAPMTTVADDNFFLFFFFIFQRKQVLTFHAWQMIHMKCQDLFPLKNKKKNKKNCRLLQILLGALRVNSFNVFMLIAVMRKSQP